MDKGFRNLTSEEIKVLESGGCISNCWEKVLISDSLNLNFIKNVNFSGEIRICEGVILQNIPGGISGCLIRENAEIINVGSIEFEPEANHGVGTLVAVLDETGSCAVPVYPGISSQIATLISREPRWFKRFNKIEFQNFIDSRVTPAEIGFSASIKNCGIIKNVFIDKEVVVSGASRLENGSLINNAASGRGITYVGSGVEAENFIIEDSKVDSKSLISNCYIGQGCYISHGFSAHDSLFFANSTMENGEAHSLLAGPYTVSMHKGTLLIGCQTSFMNAGSLSNQSNHMYKLGPVHWGIMERGVKTASGSYLMLGAKIGAFSMLMGSHKTHPDSSEFPFSYLFGDERGATVVVPGVMLRSCGLMRDEMKWPTRDRRLKKKLPLFDFITFNVLNPFTVDTMLRAINTIEELLTRPADDDLFIRYKGMKFTRAALERAKTLYTTAIFKYLSITLDNNVFPEKCNEEPQLWIDLGGQVLPREYYHKILQCDNINDVYFILSEAYEKYKELELKWVACRFDDYWRKREEYIKFNSEKFDEMVEEDRQQYLNMLSRETEMLSL